MDIRTLSTCKHQLLSKKFPNYKSLIILPMMLLPTKIFAVWSAEAASGVVYNVPTPLTIQQMGEPDIHMTAHYETRPFTMPFYYDFRIGKWNGDSAWEFEDMHHKVYLTNTTDDVSHFSISHGYNLFTINRAFRMQNKIIWRVGLGLVVAHPESTVRGQTFDEHGGTLNNGGYYIAGPTAMIALGKRFYVTKSFFFELEGKLTASYADVKVVDGSAYAPNIALHANFGLGYDF